MRNCVLIFVLFTTTSFPLISWSQTWKQFRDSAKSYSDKRETKEALYFYEKAKASLPADSSATDTHIQLLRNIGLAYFNRAEYSKALPFFVEAKVISEKLFGKDLQYASILNILAATYIQSGDYRLVEQMYLQARAIRLRLLGDKSAPYAQSCNNLGFFYWTVGTYEKAEPLIIEGKMIREKLQPLGQHPDYAISCTNLANLYRDMGQKEKAEALYKEAKDIRAKIEPLKRHPQYANSCNILADLYNLTNDYQKAEPLYLEAKEIRSENKNSYEYAESCNNLFALYRDVGRFAEAEALALEAKNIYESLRNPDDPSLTININNLGELYYKMGELEKAESFFMRARALWEKQLGKDHPYYITNSNELARLYWAKREISKADAYFISASNSNFDRIHSVFKFTSEVEKNAYLKNISGTSDEYFSFFHKEQMGGNAVQPMILSLRNRNLILSSMQQLRSLIYTSFDTSLKTKFDDWAFIKQALGRLFATTNASDNRVELLETKANQLEKDLSKSSGNFKMYQSSVPDWKLMQAALKADEAAIEFISFQYFNGKTWTDSTMYSALLLRKGYQPEMIFLFEKRELDTLLNTPDQSNIYAYSTQPAGKDIFNLVWKPMEKHLRSVKKIYYAAAGQLHQISFAAIPISRTQVLSDRFQMVQLNSTVLMTKNVESKITNKDEIHLYGGVIYDGGDTKNAIASASKSNVAGSTGFLSTGFNRGASWTYLPGTKKEVTAIKTLAANRRFTVDLREGIDATEESVKALHGKYSPAVLHIATHGFFFPDPKEDRRTEFQKSFDKSGLAFKKSDDPLMRSGLLLAGGNHAWKGKAPSGSEDGILTSYEVSGLFLPKTKLVVLSACETALGEIQGSEGVYGLQRAFKMAGVQHLIMSLWKVPDNETAEFMQQFYKVYFTGKSVADSFVFAQNNMKQKYRDEPLKWAAWILIR